MAESNEIRFLLFVSLMIFPAHALDVIFARCNEDFKQKSEISPFMVDGKKAYVGTLNPLIYRPKPDTSEVIVYIVDRSRFVEIIRNTVRETRVQIARELSEWHYELVFLGVDNFDDDEYYLISGFIAEKIQPHHAHQTNFTIKTIGESRFDQIYYHTIFDRVLHVEKYQENAQICGGTLKKRLKDIPRGAFRPVGTNGKEVRLYGYHPTVGEVRWHISMENDTYSPEVNVSDLKYNFRIRYKTKRFCLLILGGKEYLTVTNYGKRTTLKTEILGILHDMTNNNEGLILFGAFNFDWTEIGIVTQIILKHSKECEGFDYNVFTCGLGMFNSKYRNVYVRDRRNILPEQRSNVTELIKVLTGEEVKERAIKMYYSAYGWKELKIPIELENGQYVPVQRFKNYTFPWVNQKIAFIVYDSTESNNPIDIRMVYQSMGELKQSGIHVVGIEAINFGLYDVHIIAEWIDYHRGLGIQNFDGEVIDSEKIAVLGGGIFDTIFQSISTTYKILLNTKENELKNIRNAFVRKGNGKRILATQIDDPRCEVWTYPMNTINGVYEPDLIPDKNMFDNRDKKKILFIITTANHFHRISAMEKVKPVTPWIRAKMQNKYPCLSWKIFLVGLDNFGKRDYHLFAELVKMQTNFDKSLQESVCTYNHAIGDPIYQYKDTPPLSVDSRILTGSYITTFFG